MKIAVYPGSFDPITLGHLNLIKRASKVFDKLIVCVMVNSGKNPLFTNEERVEQIKLVTQRFSNVEVDSWDGLVAEYAREKNAVAVVRGLRALSDYEKECQMAIINKKINPNLETFFLAASEKYMYLSSSAVKEMGRYDVDLSDFLPEEILLDFTARINEMK